MVCFINQKISKNIEAIMNTDLIGESWDKLAEHQDALIETFYTRFFEKHPKYKSLFPVPLDRHMAKIVRTLTIVARAGDPEVVHPHLIRLGDKHRRFDLTKQDFLNFKLTFLEVLGEYCNQYCPESWNEECVQAWNEAFDDHIIPYITQGLEGRMNPSEKKRIINMQTSAGNQLLGTVISIKTEGLNSEVVLELEGGDRIASLITPTGLERLNLKIGSRAYVVIGASSVMLMHAKTKLLFSARNYFCGRVIETEIGPIGAKLTLQLKSGNIFQAFVSKQIVTELDLKKGEPVCCVFRAIDVLIAVEKGI
jgi:molybdate transport system regulatory protein